MFESEALIRKSNYVLVEARSPVKRKFSTANIHTWFCLIGFFLELLMVGPSRPKNTFGDN